MEKIVMYDGENSTLLVILPCFAMKGGLSRIEEKLTFLLFCLSIHIIQNPMWHLSV
jgi:hypothetical protein